MFLVISLFVFLNIFSFIYKYNVDGFYYYIKICDIFEICNIFEICDIFEIIPSGSNHNNYDFAKAALRFSFASPIALQDAGVPARGFSITKSCIVPRYLTAVTLTPACISLWA